MIYVFIIRSRLQKKSKIEHEISLPRWIYIMFCNSAKLQMFFIFVLHNYYHILTKHLSLCIMCNGQWSDP